MSGSCSELRVSESFVRELRATAAAAVPIVCVVTHEEHRAATLVRDAFGDKRIASWSATHGFEGDVSLRDPHAALDHLARVGHAGVVPVFFDLHPWLSEARVVRALRDVAGAERDGPVVLVMPWPRLPAELDRDARVLMLPLPSFDVLSTAFDAEVGDGFVGGDDRAPGVRLRAGVPSGRAATARGAPDAQSYRSTREVMVRAALGLTLEEARRAFRLASAFVRAGDPNLAVRHVIAEKRGALRRTACLELIDDDVSLDDVGGLDVLKSWLRSRVLAFGEEARAFGLAEPRGMLVSGVQGCGKSLVSKAAAQVLSLPLVRLDFAEVFAAPSPEHAIHEAVRAVEAVAPLVLWVDEIEKGLGGLEGPSSDARPARVFGTFLTWLQERRAPVFVAATANEVERLPPELARRGRFDDVFFVDLPSPLERAQILAVQLRRRGRDSSAYAIAELVRSLEHWSGAEIEQMVTGGLFRAFAERAELTDEHLRAAARELVPLATLYEEKIQALRQWGLARARRASADRRTLDLFGD